MIEFLLGLINYRRVYFEYDPIISAELYGDYKYQRIHMSCSGYYYLHKSEIYLHGKDISHRLSQRGESDFNIKAGNIISTFRKSIGLNQKEFANLLGIKRVTQSLIECNENHGIWEEYLICISSKFPEQNFENRFIEIHN